MSFRLKSTAIATALACAMIGSAHAAISTTALPAGATVAGSATLTQNANGLTVSGSGNSVITYSGGFDIGSAETVTFNNATPGAQATVLNVDASGTASEIDGKIQSNGVNLIIANQNGITIGSGAVITDPGQTVELLAQQVNANQFASSGTFTFGSANPTTLTIAPGSSVSGAATFVVGAGVVNIGGAVQSTGTTHIYGGAPASSVTMQFSDTQPFGWYKTANSYNAAPAGAVQTQINLLSTGSISGQSVVISNDGSVQGAGTINANILNAYIAGSFNNPNGGGDPANSWFPNHITINPFTPNSAVSVFSVLSSTSPSFWNLWVNGNATYYPNSYSDTTRSPAYGSHLLIQASGNLTINALSNIELTPFTGASQVPSGLLATFPGLVVAVAGSAGNGSVNNTSTLQLDADLSNMVTDGQPGQPSGAGLGIFLQAGKIVGANGNSAPNLYVNGSGSSWVNIDGATPFGVNVYDYAAPSTLGVAPNSVIHYRSY